MGHEQRSSSSCTNNYLDTCGLDFWELRKPPCTDLKLSRAMCQVPFQMAHNIPSHLVHNVFNIHPSAHYNCQRALCKPFSTQFGFTRAFQATGKIQSFYRTIHSFTWHQHLLGVQTSLFYELYICMYI